MLGLQLWWRKVLKPLASADFLASAGRDASMQAEDIRTATACTVHKLQERVRTCSVVNRVMFVPTEGFPSTLHWGDWEQC